MHTEDECIIHATDEELLNLYVSEAESNDWRRKGNMYHECGEYKQRMYKVIALD